MNAAGSAANGVGDQSPVKGRQLASVDHGQGEEIAVGHLAGVQKAA